MYIHYICISYILSLEYFFFFFLLDFRKDKEIILVFSLIAKGDLNIVKKKKRIARWKLTEIIQFDIDPRIYILEFCDPYDVVLAVRVRRKSDV